MFLSLNVVHELIYRIILLLAYLITVPIIGFVRAWASKAVGDDTAEQLGFLTVNPVVHISPFWLILMQFFHIGFGNHVPINPLNIRGKMRGLKMIFAYLCDAMVSILIAVFAMIIITVLVKSSGSINLGNPIDLLTGNFENVGSWNKTLRLLFTQLMYLNMALATFNMIVNTFYVVMFYFFEDFASNYEHIELVMIVGPIVLLCTIWNSMQAIVVHLIQILWKLLLIV